MILFSFIKRTVYNTVSFSLFVNNDKTEVLLEPRLKSAVHVVGRNTLSVGCRGSINTRMTVCVSVPCDEIKPLFFLVFKGQPIH